MGKMLGFLVFVLFFGFVAIFILADIPSKLAYPATILDTFQYTFKVWMLEFEFINDSFPLWVSIPFIWIPLSIGLLWLVAQMFFRIFPDTEGQLETEPNINPYWVEFGNRLKIAYSAKFGGENLGFNDEVDKRVLMMQSLRDGFTRRLAKDWLKRMERFTESK